MAKGASLLAYAANREEVVTAHFNKALREIESANRHLTPWESLCFLLALKAIATNDWALANRHIAQGEGPAPRSHRSPPIDTTVEQLRSGVAAVRRLRERQRTRVSDAAAANRGY